MWVALGFLVALAGVILVGVRRSDLRTVRVVAVLVSVVLVLPLVAAVGLGIYLRTPRDGDRVAAERAEAAATAVADEIVLARYSGNGALGGEQLALDTVRRAAEYEYGLGVWDARDIEIVVLDWSGPTAGGSSATVDIRVEAHVPYDPGPLLGRSRSEGRSVGCWRMVNHYYEYDEGAEVDQIACPATPVGQVPVPDGVPTLGSEARATVLRALREAPAIPDDVSPVETEQIVEEVQTAWWQQSSPEELDGYGVEVYAQHEEGTLVLAVGNPARRECVIGVREAGSAPVLYTGAPDGDLAPGGSGCQPALYWRGALTRLSEPGPAPEPATTASPAPSRPWPLDEATTPANEKLLLGALGGLPADANAAEARQAVAEAFSDYTVDAHREDDELVATVAGPTYRDCLVAVRTGDRAPVRFTDFLRISLEPGEIGCRPSLYWTDVTAH
ncbi:hypothetical protein ACO229_23520 [Promicromonospora sp. MS192]|uniref:hypothetical protein n=1 Tax=Promicromonospora sp. MS192 TaxID=3412684 RepID=UPI003C2EBB35